MTTPFAVLLTCCAGCVLSAATPSDAIRLLTSVPVHFEPAGKNPDGRFIARGLRYHFQFEKNRAVLDAGDRRISLSFESASRGVTLEGLDELASKTTAIHGNDPAKWRSNIANYGRLRASGLYRGIDLIYYGSASELEYDLVLRPDADARQIKLRLSGTTAHLDEHGDLTSEIIQKHPVAYQLGSNGSRTAVESGYRKNRDGSYGFVLGPYDRRRELVIDPVLSLSLYLSGSGDDQAAAIGHDDKGLLYIGGTTGSTDFPQIGNSEQATLKGDTDAFIAVLDPTRAAGSQVIYTTFFGGSLNEILQDMVVTGSGTVFATGSTTSSDMPTANPSQLNLSGTQDAFVLKLIPSQGTAGLFYASYLGGTQIESGNGIAVDASGKIYVVGTTTSTDFPSPNGFQTSSAGTQDAFLVKIDPSLSLTATLVYSTYVGGTAENSGNAVAVAPDGTVWIAGWTSSSDFPIGGYCMQCTINDAGDAFLVHVDTTLGGKSLIYGTFFGGSEPDAAKKIAVDSKGRVIVTGYTVSPDLHVTADAMQPIYGGNTDAFIAILDTSILTGDRYAQLVYSTYFGGSQGDVPYDVKVDSGGRLYVSGFTTSPDMPISSNALRNVYDDNLDGFVLVLDPTKSGLAGLLYGTYIGSDGVQIANGIDFDAAGTIYITGYTSGGIFDLLGGVSNPKGNGLVDVYVMGFKTSTVPAPASAILPRTTTRY